MNSQFCIGVVESRDDPLKLGRFRVRVFGVHSESLVDIPTSSLPWAIPLSNFAGVSGLGMSPSYVEGSMVYVFFQDGESKQQPIILGSIASVPMSTNPFDSSQTDEIATLTVSKTNTPSQVATVTVASSNSLSDSYGNPVTDASGAPIAINPIDIYAKLKAMLGQRESSNNYRAVNQLGYLGKYQMGAAILIDLGYVKSGTRNANLKDPAVWNGKSGISSKEDFLASISVQESAMDSAIVMNEKTLTRIGVLDSSTTAQEKAGYLATAHLIGCGGAKKMKNGTVSSDANGVTGNEYYKLGYASVSGSLPVVSPDATNKDNPARQESIVDGVGTTIKGSQLPLESIGFVDPNGIYPKYIKEQDTNRLLRNQNIDKTIVSEKEATLERGVPIAHGGGAWDQSQVPYNATYPYNKVMETEAGHVMEFDDTPNNERIHIYHKSGTFTETDRNGTTVNKIVGDSFQIIERNGYVYVKGVCNITIDGSANVMVGNDCNLDVGGNFDVRAGGDIKMYAGGNLLMKSSGNTHISGAGTFAVDSTSVHINSGESTAGGLSGGSASKSEISFAPMSLEPRAFESLTDFDDADLSDDEVNSRESDLESKGLTDINKTDGVVGEPILPEVNKDSGIISSCGAFIQGKININDFISPNFRLRDLTSGRPIESQCGYTDAELACNLKNLAENVLEPIKAKYPDMIITSGLRPMGANPRSQHPKGEAADIQFRNHHSSDYLAIAKDLAALVPTDQLILEYRTSVRRSGVPTTWIHVSYSKSGLRHQLFTMDNDKRISDFGKLVSVA